MMHSTPVSGLLQSREFHAHVTTLNELRLIDTFRQKQKI